MQSSEMLNRFLDVTANNLAVNAVIMATKEAIYCKRQGNRIPDIFHMKRILYNQTIKEKVIMSSKVEESNLWKNGVR